MAETVESAAEIEAEIAAYAGRIQTRDRRAEGAARALVDNLVKPTGSLGVLEELAVMLAGIFGRLDYRIEDKANIIFCGDNGVFEEGYGKYPRQISRLVAEIMAAGKGGGSLLARTLGARTRIVNLGLRGRYREGETIPAAAGRGAGSVAGFRAGDGAEGAGFAAVEGAGPDAAGGGAGLAAADITATERLVCPAGTGNITVGPALTRQQACQALRIGIEETEALIRQGARVIAAGEIGLGNTTTAAAVLAVFTGLPPADLTGMGSGTTGPALERKIAAVERALAVNRPAAADPIGVLAKVGGLDIAAMTGAYLACGVHRVPAALDGFIAQAAAFGAAALRPLVKEYMIPAHISGEKGAPLAAAALGLRPPVLRLDMRLGEGTGACLLFPLLDCAAAMLREMATFDDLARWFPADWPPA
jgi:nicotinate-nucleotide--dimethylbenzimidazole phosphoribosyltransferase